jgi:hypothetical protein
VIQRESVYPDASSNTELALKVLWSDSMSFTSDDIFECSEKVASDNVKRREHLGG